MWHSITARMPLRNQERPRLRESAELLRGLRMFCITRQVLAPDVHEIACDSAKRRSLNVYDRLCCVS